MNVNDALVMILAGGEGKRLFPLTKDRAKPAVPFGGRYRIIDFVLNNFINSGFFKIKVLTQYKSDSLNKHITRGWTLSPFLNQYVDLAPAQMRTGNDWYKGTADAIPIEEASEFGIMEVDENWKLIKFVEKPQYRPKSIPGNPNMCLASMGNYIFDKEVLLDALNRDAQKDDSAHDFGKNVIPMLLSDGNNLYVYNFG